jgi:hypothetical protein
MLAIAAICCWLVRVIPFSDAAGVVCVRLLALFAKEC